MVSGSRIEGGPQILSAGVRKTIQSIKEIVGNHSDADIYVVLKETNMDPNETAQKLLNQDPFHEVKRKRDKKKELTQCATLFALRNVRTKTLRDAKTHLKTLILPQVTGYKGSTGLEPRKSIGNVVGQGMRVDTIESDHNVRRGGYARNALPGTGVSREFRVVRDNRVNQNASREIKPSVSKTEPVISNVSDNSNIRGRSSNQKPPVRPHSSLSSNRPAYRQARNSNSSGSDRKDISEERQLSVPNAAAVSSEMKLNDSSTVSSSLNSGSGVLGVYSSSSDPVHVPSLDSRPAANKREVGVVGVRRHFSKNNSSAQSTSFSNPHLGPGGLTRESSSSFRSFTAASENDQPPQTTTIVSESAAMPSMPAGRSFLNNHQQQHNSSNRSHQQIVAHHKASQPSKEWKPKSSQKPNVNGPGVIGAPAKSVSPAAAATAADNLKEYKAEAAELQDKVSRVKISENQNVIIAAHIRVSETDRSRLTFGSLGAEFDPSQVSELQALGGAQEFIEPSASVSIFSPESSGEETSGSKQGDLIDECGRNSGSNSPASENQLADRKVSSSSPQDLGSYADIGLVHDETASYIPSESQQQQQDPPELPTFSSYDPQSGYDIQYFRPIVDETARGQGLLSPQEDLSSHMVNSIPASTIAMVQQQQQQQVPPVAQMYPQVHVSHFANLMPYRQYISPVYVPPPMAMPGYSSNPAAYPHPSNASSYVLMPGGSSPHLTANGLKYGIPQFKPLPTGSPTGFGNFTSPTGYTINSPGVVGGVTGIEDSSRLKYKDGNLYIPNLQAETSEIWMNPRDLPSLQSASYYNMAGQVPHGATYLPSHTGHHASFNAAAAAQSSHMQFPGLYHPPQQPAAIANPHHLGPAMGGNVGVGVAAAGAAPGAQLGAYQQPQLGHLSWTGNF